MNGWISPLEGQNPGRGAGLVRDQSVNVLSGAGRRPRAAGGDAELGRRDRVGEVRSLLMGLRQQ